MKNAILVFLASLLVMACGGGSSSSTETSLSKTSPTVVNQAKGNAAQYVWVEYHVQSDLGVIWEEYKAQETARGVAFTRAGFWESPAYKELIREYEATWKAIFPDGRLGTSVVATIYSQVPAVLVEVFDLPSLMQILSNDKVKQVHVPGQYDWDHPQIEDEICLPPYPECPGTVS